MYNYRNRAPDRVREKIEIVNCAGLYNVVTNKKGPYRALLSHENDNFALTSDKLRNASHQSSNYKPFCFLMCN